MNTFLAGLTIALVGMGVVFVLLATLWGLVALLLRFEQSTPEAAQSTAQASTLNTEPADTGINTTLPVSPDLIAAITIAVLSHRTVQRKQGAPSIRSHQPGTLLHASRWVAAGRTRQNRSWRQ